MSNNLENIVGVKSLDQYFIWDGQWPQASSGAIYHKRWGSGWQVQPSFITNKNWLQIINRSCVLCFDYYCSMHSLRRYLYIWFLFIEIVSIRIDPNYRVARGTLYWGSLWIPWSPQNEAIAGHSFTTQSNYPEPRSLNHNTFRDPSLGLKEV